MKRYYIDIGSGVFLASLAGFLMVQLDGIPREGVILPIVVLWALLICSALMIVEGLVKRDARRIDFFEGTNIFHFVSIAIIFFFSIYLCLYFSYTITIFLMNFSVVSLLTEKRTNRKIGANVLFSGSVVLFIYMFFTVLMRVYFPEPFFS